jgi:hypothetical protein
MPARVAAKDKNCWLQNKKTHRQGHDCHTFNYCLLSCGVDLNAHGWIGQKLIRIFEFQRSFVLMYRNKYKQTLTAWPCYAQRDTLLFLILKFSGRTIDEEFGTSKLVWSRLRSSKFDFIPYISKRKNSVNQC